jgi:alkanesulfonate monooxygenase SsuD/methylene tetrahydromethanopterin reductase-like flavin-dependent oxidoreductase (luciferase family)
MKIYALAREMVTLDHLSSGRLILGVGLGWSPQEFEILGEDGNPKT